MSPILALLIVCNGLKLHFFTTGLFCLHVLCMLDHLRVDSVPVRYILRRYTIGARQRGTFDRRDYKTQASDGTSYLYQQNEVLQLAMKVVRKATCSEEQRARAKVGLQALYDELDAMGSSTPDNDEDGSSQCPDIDEFEPDETQFWTENQQTYPDCPNQQDNQPDNDGNSMPHRVILPPPKSKTKGSRNKEPGGSKPPGAMKKKKVQKTGKKEGKNTCSICKLKAGHNSRSCPSDPRVMKQLAISKIKAPRRKMCSGCHKYGTGHNSLTCPVTNGLKLKAKLKKKMLTRI